MKKFISILLAVALLLCGAFLTYAMAEAEGGGTPPAPVVDLTRVAVSALVLIFEFLLAWIAKVIVPPLRNWLKTNTTERQRSLLWDAVTSLVEAAEQTILGPGRGKERLKYVVEGLMKRGFTVDLDMIESAVKTMNDKTKQAFREAFEPVPGVLTETKEREADGQERPKKDYCDLDDDGIPVT